MSTNPTPPAYPSDAGAELVRVLEVSRLSRRRVRITHRNEYGEWTSVGYVGSSTGVNGTGRTAILVYRWTSLGGQLLDGGIVKVEHSNRRKGGILWRRHDAL